MPPKSGVAIAVPDIMLSPRPGKPGARYHEKNFAGRFDQLPTGPDPLINRLRGSPPKIGPS